MDKKVFRLFSLLLLPVALLATIISCGGSTKTDSNIKHTYRDVWSAMPLNWSPHSWKMDIDNAFANYVSTPFIYSSMDADKGEGHWKWGYSAATAVTDITKDFADKAKYNIPADAVKDRVYEIKLNPAMKWQNGDPIKATDYIYSMQMLLSSKMKNYRASTYISGVSAIVNAKGYFNNDRAGQGIYKQYEKDKRPGNTKLFFTLTDDIAFFGDKAQNFYKKEQHKAKFISDGTDLFKKYAGQKYFAVSAESKADMLAIAKAFGDNNPEAWQEFVVYDTGKSYKETPWEDVGLFATDEYTLVYITDVPFTLFYMMGHLTDTWLVHKKTYEDNFKTIEQLQSSSYGTSMETTMSCGPYKITSFEKGKQIRLDRNPEWCGYHDGLHEGQYAADAVIIDIIENHATEMQRFGQGLVDVVGLTSEDLEKYKKSDRAYYEPKTGTWRYIFATSKESLKARDNEKGSGKRIVMHYKDFRKALSLCIDRQKFCKEATSGFVPAYYLLNTMYFYDIENNPDSVYRNSKAAKKAILDLYHTKYSDATVDSEYEKITGRDVETAQKLFKKAYQQAVADGSYSDGEIVPLEIMVSPSDLTPQAIKQQDLLQEFFNEGSKGTPFEGKIQVKFEHGDAKRYENVVAGKNMAIWGAWNGAAFYPFNVLLWYTDPEFMGGLERIMESNGWDPRLESLTVAIKKHDGKEIKETMTLTEWVRSVQSGAKYAEHISERLQVLAALERAVLESYQCIPIGAATSAKLASYKVEFRTDVYNIMYGFGDGLREIQFNYTDAEWQKYLSEHGGSLNYE